MSEAVQIAIVTASAAIAGTVVGAAVTNFFESRRERWRAQVEDRRVAEKFSNDYEVRLEGFIREQRAKQGERIRHWVESQAVAGVDIAHLLAVAEVRGDPVAQQAALQAAERIIATRMADAGRSPSVHAALTGITDPDLARDVRSIDHDARLFDRHLDGVRQFLRNTPVPWEGEQAEEAAELLSELRNRQEYFDGQLIDLYDAIERYCAAIATD